MPFDAFRYLEYLDQMRYRAIILHTSPEKGNAATRFAQSLCRKANGKYLDLLGLFIHEDELREKIDSFNPEKFRALLIEQSKGVDLLCVDRSDFLLDTWRREERKNFYHMIKDQWDAYKDGTTARLIVILQTSSELEQQKIMDSQDQSRVLRLSDFNDIL
ncbi:MAG TPA: hypothetical protein VK206_26645 [Anaerolineales bacterium]|nr:hypothetical protein [Anaerolineales bacterium]